VVDLLAVKNGTTPAYAVRPYEYGEFPTPFATNAFGGGTFDSRSGLLYLTVQKADRLQGTYSNPPIVVAFGFAVEQGGAAATAPVNLLLLSE
jgi:hypothetical protein